MSVLTLPVEAAASSLICNWRGFSSHKVKLWAISLGAGEGHLREYSSVLSDEERQRVTRYRFEGDRRRSVVARGALRIILGSCLGMDPASLVFRSGEHGKPELTDMRGDLVMSFNVSHSGELILIGVVVGRRIGVDIERICEKGDIERVAKRFFAAEESTAILATPAEARSAAFFSWWTAKEAYLKAVGHGLSGGLNSFTLIPGADRWNLQLSRSAGPEASVDWIIRSLDLVDGYAAAVAVEGDIGEVEIVRLAGTCQQP